MTCQEPRKFLQSLTQFYPQLVWQNGIFQLELKWAKVNYTYSFALTSAVEFSVCGGILIKANTFIRYCTQCSWHISETEYLPLFKKKRVFSPPDLKQLTQIAKFFFVLQPPTHIFQEIFCTGHQLFITYLVLFKKFHSNFHETRDHVSTIEHRAQRLIH